MRWLKHRKLLYCAFALLLFCLLLPSCYPPCAYAETTYTITEQELMTLEQNLQTLEEHSKSKDESLRNLKKQLQTVNARLTSLQESNQTMQESLANAEESLKQYEKEMKHKQAVKERQRNMWIAIAGIATVWAITK